MLPREFNAVYGVPVIRQKQFTGPVVFVVDANPDRYLLGVTVGIASAEIIPDTTPNSVVDGWVITSTSPPFLLTQTLHGSLPGMGFQIVGAGPGSITIIEGFMRPPTIKRQPRGGNAKISKDAQRNSPGRDRNRARG